MSRVAPLGKGDHPRGHDPGHKHRVRDGKFAKVKQFRRFERDRFMLFFRRSVSPARRRLSMLPGRIRRRAPGSTTTNELENETACGWWQSGTGIVPVISPAGSPSNESLRDPTKACFAAMTRAFRQKSGALFRLPGAALISLAIHRSPRLSRPRSVRCRSSENVCVTVCKFSAAFGKSILLATTNHGRSESLAS